MVTMEVAYLLTLATLASALGKGGILAHQRLVRDLLDDYDSRVRPVRNHSDPVHVIHRMNLYQILDVNEPSQNVKLYAWVTQFWDDVFLGWDPKEYEGIKTIVLPYTEIWMPDTYLYNSVEMTRESTERWMSITYTTNTSYNPPIAHAFFMYPALFTFSCKMDILYFPFDIQNCTMTFSSWTFDSGGIDFFPHRNIVTFESYVANEEWDVISFNYVRESVKYACCPFPWTLLHAHLVIQRKPLYYFSNLVVPTVIIALIAMVGFFMPSSTTGERTQRVDLGINTLLAMSILLLMVSDDMPTTSTKVPLMGWFFLSIIFLISSGTFMSSVLIIVQAQGQYGKRVPKCIRGLFFHCVAVVLRVTPPPGFAKKERESEAHCVDDANADEAPLVTIFRNLDKSNGLRRTTSHRSRGSRRTRSPSPRTSGLGAEFGLPPPSPGAYPRPVLSPTDPFPNPAPRLILTEHQVSQLDTIEQNLSEMRSFIYERQYGTQAMLEWEYLASILDRLLLCLFCSAVLGVMTSMILVGLFKDQGMATRRV